jgi:hypothetical protein
MLRQEGNVDDVETLVPVLHLEAADRLARPQDHEPIRIGEVLPVMQVLRAELHGEKGRLLFRAPWRGRELVGAGRRIEPREETAGRRRSCAGTSAPPRQRAAREGGCASSTMGGSGRLNFVLGKARSAQ